MNDASEIGLFDFRHEVNDENHCSQIVVNSNAIGRKPQEAPKFLRNHNLLQIKR